ncbi:MAG: hypothetical protein IPK74_18540 [Deltaproteobacteria bacterium]|nr:hypothetical protein [Deltaproteobacteria bacterium]
MSRSRGGAPGKPGRQGHAAAPTRADERAAALFDRIEDRLRDAPDGFHDARPPATADALSDAALPDDERALWRRWDGIDFAAGEARLLPAREIAGATAAALAEGLIQAGDRVVAEHGRDLFVLPEDPWAEGAGVVRVEEAGDRSPESTSVAHLVLGWLGEFQVLYDEHGDFREDLFGEDGEPTAAVQRKLCRRRLDFDPDAPNPRLRLAELLREAGEHVAAKAELVQVIKRAPEFAWPHHELGRTFAALGERERAVASFRRAAECTTSVPQQAFHLAWAAWQADDRQRAALAAEVTALRPEFALQQAGAVAELIERERFDAAAEQLAIGLAIGPGHLELLRLRGVLAQAQADAAAAPPEPPYPHDPSLDEDDDLDDALDDDDALEP